MRAQLQIRVRFLAAIIASLPVCVRAQNPAPTYSITIAVSSLAGTPLGYSTVAVAEIHVERFSNSFGELYLMGLREGEYHIRVKQLGFSAREMAVRLGPDAPNVRVVVRLQPIAFLLDKIVVTAPSKCPEPTDLSDPRNFHLALIFGEVRKNAERHNLLLSRYPFRYRFAREFATATKFLGSRNVKRDTVEFASDVDWKYEPGSIVIRDSTDENSADLMRLPQLSDLADTTFQANHCFYYRGRTRRDGELQHQIDFIPLGSISDPDVEGSIFIDAKSYVLRSALFRLTGGYRFNPPLPEMDIRTTFKEIYPGIVLFSEIQGLEPMYRAGGKGGFSYTETRQKQKLIDYSFIRGAPGDSSAGVRRDSVQAAGPRRDSARASFGSVGGTVFALDRNPIGSAKIVAGDGNLQVASDSKGNFILGSLTPGDTEITVSAPGFSTIRISVEIVAGKLLTVALVLYPDK